MGYDLRCHPEYRARWLGGFELSLFPVCLDRGQTKVAYFDGPFLVMLVIVKTFDFAKFVSHTTVVVGLLFGYKKYVVRLEIAMKNVTTMQVGHSGCRLLADIDELADFPVLLFHMQMAIKTRARTPLGDDGQIRLQNATDEQENVVVSSKF